MRAAPLPPDEAGRIEALLQAGVLDTLPEPVFDDVAALAGHICGTPIALVSLIDDHRQWFKARVGLEARETPRDLAFCAHAILEPGLTEIEDASSDERFSDNPLVTGVPGIRFYAGAPLIVRGGHALGTLCVIDRVPRRLGEAQRAALATLSRHVAAELDLRRQARALALEVAARQRAEAQLRERNETLKSFAYLVAHDLKAPLRGIFGYARELVGLHAAEMGERARHCADQIVAASRSLDSLLDDLLHYASVETETPAWSELDLAAIVDGVLGERRLAIEQLHAEVTKDVSPVRVFGWERGVRQVLSNLVDNALKYSQHSSPPRVHIAAVSLGEAVELRVSDNGIGFDMRHHEQIYGLFNRLVRASDFTGNGAGLAIVRSLLDKQGGRIWATAEPGKGATFVVEIPDHVEKSRMAAGAASTTRSESRAGAA